MKRTNLAPLTLGVVVLLFCACKGNLMAQQQCAANAPVPSLILVQSPANLNTTSGVYVPMAGLQFVLCPVVPPASAQPIPVAVITLNVPNPYAIGTNFPGGCFSIAINNQVQDIYACFTTDIQDPNPPSNDTGRMPTTLVIQRALPQNTTLTGDVITAVWENVRGDEVVLDSPATLSAVIAPTCNPCRQ